MMKNCQYIDFCNKLQWMFISINDIIEEVERAHKHLKAAKEQHKIHAETNYCWFVS